MNAEEDTCLIYLLKYIIQHQVYFDYGTDNHTHHNTHLEIKNIMIVNNEVIKSQSFLKHNLGLNRYLPYINFILVSGSNLLVNLTMVVLNKNFLKALGVISLICRKFVRGRSFVQFSLSLNILI